MKANRPITVLVLAITAITTCYPTEQDGGILGGSDTSSYHPYALPPKEHNNAISEIVRRNPAIDTTADNEEARIEKRCNLRHSAVNTPRNANPTHTVSSASKRMSLLRIIATSSRCQGNSSRSSEYPVMVLNMFRALW